MEISFTRRISMQFAFALLLISAVIPNLKAQAPQSQPGIKIVIEKENGSVEEVIIPEGSINIEQFLKERNLLQDAGTIKPGEEVEIIVRRRESSGNESNVIIRTLPELNKIQNFEFDYDFDEQSTGKAYLGVYFDPASSSDGAKVTSVIEGTPAQTAGFQTGDRIISVNGQPVSDENRLDEIIPSFTPGTTVKLEVMRGSEKMELTAVLGEKPAQMKVNVESPGIVMLDKHMMIPEERAWLGVNLGGSDGEVLVESVHAGSPAEKVGLKAGDVVTKVNGTPVTGSYEMIEKVRHMKPSEQVTLEVKRGGETMNISTSLGRWSDYEGEYDQPEEMNEMIEAPVAPEYNFECGDMEGDLYQSKKEARKMEREMKKLNREMKKLDSDLEMLNDIDGELVPQIEITDGQFEINDIPASEDWDQVFSLKISGEELSEEEAAMLSDKSGMEIPAVSTLNPTAFVMYPNPSDGKFSVAMTADASGPLHVTIVDMNGKVVTEVMVNDFAGAYAGEFDITQETKGSYVLRMEVGGKVHVRKLVTQ